MGLSIRRGVAAVAVIAAALAIWTQCERGTPMERVLEQPRFDAVDSSGWSALAGKRIFFAHQSVGENIMTGVREVIDGGAGPRMTVVESSDPRRFAGPLFGHTRVGANDDPAGKLRHFKSLLESGIGDSVDIAMVKLCFVDITPETDVARLCDEYCSIMDSLRVRFPRVVFVVLTVPLQQRNTGMSGMVRSLLGKRGNELGNVKRCEFNRMLIERCGTHMPVCDLAAVESTRPDGTRESFVSNGKRYPALAGEYTDDGGHLNRRGSVAAAKALMAVLARVASDKL
jgi:hypothetical protein